MNTLKSNDFPFDHEQNLVIDKLFESMNISNLYWLHGYIQALILSRENSTSKQESTPQFKISKTEASIAPSKSDSQITVLYGTHTGNSRRIASQLHQKLEGAGHSLNVKDVADFRTRDIKSEKCLILIISTHGEGQPPLAAEDFYEYIHSNHAPALPELSFAVLGLGDKSYFSFCKTAADIDLRLEQLGGKRLIPRAECDVDYAKTSEDWINNILQSLPKKIANIQLINKPDVLQPEIVLPTRENPVDVHVLNKINMNGRGSEKRTYHIELQLPSEQMNYTPGDSIGIIPQNNHNLVDEILLLLKASPDKVVDFGHSSGQLRNILTIEVELTKLTRENLEKYTQIANNRILNNLIKDTNKMSDFLYGASWVDLLRLYPCNINTDKFLSLVRQIQPRLYSVASSARAFPGEVHITVSQLNYTIHGQKHYGACSTYLSELPESQDNIKLFFETNDIFRLPSDDTDIIMIGPGTGVAPFRAFMQEREQKGATGKNWLFFGDRHFTTDFLYQTEWQNFHKKSLLSRIDLAFSRDQQQKIYVQHRLLEKSRDVYHWLENGAKIYVCGDMKKMAPDVMGSFVKIVSKEGGITLEKANEYVKTLRKEKRYLEDVY